MDMVKQLRLGSENRVPLLLRNARRGNHDGKDMLPAAAKQTRETQVHAAAGKGKDDETASIFFIGTATTIIDWQGFRILTDPNFLHAGDQAHLGPGVKTTRRTNPALDLDHLPPLDCILLSHYHEDHFDRVVEASMNRDFPIITTSHARQCLTQAKDEPFRNVESLEPFESVLLPISADSQRGRRTIKITGLPGKHVPPGLLSTVNDNLLLGAVPPTNGWLLELGYATAERENQARQESDIDVVFRIYISGDTLYVDELEEIPKRLNIKPLDLMLVHLGGTTIPGPSAPLLMVTMDGKQGVRLLQLMNPEITIPIHYDDYDVFASPLSDFKAEVDKAGLKDRVVYLDRGEAYQFAPRE
ncbi:hypothetical protein NOR_07449 [Metarhizium rileyi]|uniref:Metallo-beta-lactamase domain-containing protein n=1 Tax=Metarhizium rileyi (strain RCEF 4871) TaxID=1649241 RepID=A0A166Y8U8_METRR|nr:hypothetical protein NOR_07449 [Metarhizium rileyi RCEF 4871]